MANYTALSEVRDPFGPYGLISQAMMFWSRKYLVKSGQASEEHVSGLPLPVDLNFFVESLQDKWSKQQRRAKPSFFRAVMAVFWKKYVWYMLPFVCKAFGQLVIAVAISLLTESLGDQNSSYARTFELVLLYSIASFFTVCMVNQGFFRGNILGTIVRATLFTVLYDKALSLPTRDLMSNKVSARLTNLVASDVDQVEYICATWYLFITPLFVIISTPVVYWLIGPAGLVGVGCVLIFLPVKSYLAKFVANFYRNTSNLTEMRLKETQTLTEGIKPIKMFSWESDLLKRISQMRRIEYREHCNMNIHRNLTTTLFFSGGAILMFVTIVTFIALGNDIETGRMFGAIGILLTMNNWTTGIMSWGVDMVLWYKSLFANLTEFMSLQEQTEERHLVPAGSNPSVVCEDLYVSWSSSDQPSSLLNQVELATRSASEVSTPNRSVLQNVNLTLNKGELVMIVGMLGSGKSSLLSALNGDLKINEGRICISSSVAYVTQDPWIISGTVRENIIMGLPYDEPNYARVIDMCGLRQDFEQMQESDATIIGDSGSTLSGGQKARIALARAVYRGKDVYLMDDPLSAVDAKVGLHIFNECVRKGLNGKTRVLVTHHHKFLPQADRIVIMHEGKVLLQGSYSELENSPELRSVLSCQQQPQHSHSKPVHSSILQTFDEFEYRHVIEEESEIGAVPLRIYVKYLLMFFRSGWALLILAVLMAVLQLVNLSASYWVSYWAVQTPEDQKDPWFGWVLAGIIAALLVLSVLRNFLVLEGLNLCNQKLHERALKGVAKTDLSFFDTNPSGRIMSRFTKDISVVENVLLKYFSDLLMLGCLLISYVVALVVTMPVNLLALVVILTIAIRFGYGLVSPSRQLKRLELATKADLVSLVTASINGISTIRSLELGGKFRAKFTRMTEVNYMAWFCYFVNSRTFQVLNDYLGILFLSFNAFVCVFLKGTIPADVLAVGFSFTVLVISYLGWFSDVYINVGNQMISVHRLYQYTLLPPESDPFPTQKLRVTQGEISFESASLRYAPHLNLALRELTFTIPGGSKVGIVGRTGAGKSSLLLALFRLKGLEGGRICVDGQDIAKVGLQALRSQIAVIPQSPLLFYGDVAKNVDPTNNYRPEQVAAILSELQLSAEATSDARQLSAGQKQLLCLARVFLQDSQILVCDEATGSIDPKTEDFVQQLMQTRLATKTVVTIAHRLKTILHCDQVVVLDNGRCVEMGKPEELAKGESYFERLLEASQASS